MFRKLVRFCVWFVQQEERVDLASRVASFKGGYILTLAPTQNREEYPCIAFNKDTDLKYLYLKYLKETQQPQQCNGLLEENFSSLCLN